MFTHGTIFHFCHSKNIGNKYQVPGLGNVYVYILDVRQINFNENLITFATLMIQEKLLLHV